jgi:hypothetical protein
MSAEQQHSIDEIGPDGVEIARYRVSAERRRLVGRRAHGGIEITDHPVCGRGAAYRVDRGFREFEQLRAFVEDYLRQAERLDACPMSSDGILAMLAESEAELIADLLGDCA